jgi:hypothetical protein
VRSRPRGRGGASRSGAPRYRLRDPDGPPPFLRTHPASPRSPVACRSAWLRGRHRCLLVSIARPAGSRTDCRHTGHFVASSALCAYSAVFVLAHRRAATEAGIQLRCLIWGTSLVRHGGTTPSGPGQAGSPGPRARSRREGGALPLPLPQEPRAM